MIKFSNNLKSQKTLSSQATPAMGVYEYLGENLQWYNIDPTETSTSEQQ